jgi:hypothetical protein
VFERLAGQPVSYPVRLKLIKLLQSFQNHDHYAEGHGKPMEGVIPAIAEKTAAATIVMIFKSFDPRWLLPLGRRMCSHSKVDSSPPFMRQHKEYVQGLEPNGRHGEEVYGD